MAHHDQLAAAVFKRQYGLIARSQARALGFTDNQIKHRTRLGQWTSVERSVYQHCTANPSWHSRVLAPCLGLGAVASHRTAAALWNLDGFRHDRPEITVPPDRGIRRPGLRLHRTTQAHLFDITKKDGIPTTGLPRTLLDLAAVVPRHKLRQAIDDARRRELVDWPDLWRVLTAHSAKGRDGCGRLRSFLDQHYGESVVTRSEWSSMVADLLHVSGLPRPAVEHEVTDHNGFVGFLDLAYPAHKVGIELDSVRWHFNLDSFHKDPHRRNRMENAGWSIRNFTWKDYSERAWRLVDTVERALHLHPRAA